MRGVTRSDTRSYRGYIERDASDRGEVLLFLPMKMRRAAIIYVAASAHYAY